MQFHSNRSTIGKMIASMRQRRKITQQELANELGMSRGSIANVEAGIDQPSLMTLQKICDHLQFSLSFTVSDQVPYCAGCGTTQNLHRDYGSGGPWRCNSHHCMIL